MTDADQSLRAEVRDIWDRIAPFWDEWMGEGNSFQRDFLAPVTERLLDVQPGQTVLEIACGNGYFARRLASLGATVVATDLSPVMIERARRRTPAGTAIEYDAVDACDEAGLLALGERRFDGAACIMGLMDMPEIEPLAAALPLLLKPGGKFVFSVTHPCFNTTGMTILAERSYEGLDLKIDTSVRLTRYLTPQHDMGIGVVGQPVAQHYFDRPLNVLLGTFFRAGLVMDALEEPRNEPKAGEQVRPLSWDAMPEIPPALICRLTLPR